jgi:hypothetical protein
MTPTITPEAARLAEEAKRLGYELDGVIIDTEQAGGFDAVCLRTVKRVRQALAVLAKQDAAPTSAARLDIGPWTVTETGNVISADFKHDVVLGISGDFTDKAERMTYGRWLADTLNAAPTSASTVPAGFWLAPMEPDDAMVNAWFDGSVIDRFRAMRDSYLARNPGACSVTDGEAKK